MFSQEMEIKPLQVQLQFLGTLKTNYELVLIDFVKSTWYVPEREYGCIFVYDLFCAEYSNTKRHNLVTHI
jgi:hypothetical protein